MLKTVDLVYKTMYAELSQRSMDDAFAADFPVAGSIVSAKRGDREYFYYQPNDGKRLYVGTAKDPEVAKRVADFQYVKEGDKGRRKMVQTLIRQAYLPRPEPKVGDVVDALAEAGLFRLRGVLVGTVAYGCYSSYLGVRLPGEGLKTEDVDFAQFHSISAAVDDSTPPMLDVIRTVDPTFREVPGLSGPSTQYLSKDRFKVEFITPNQWSDDQEGKALVMPALGGTGAFPLRFLDYLIHEPVRAVMLHGAGVPVRIPAPERYAIHKLILASRRRDDREHMGKIEKDILQSSSIIAAMTQQRMEADLAMAYVEAWKRGPKWRDGISTGLSLAPEETRDAMIESLIKGMEIMGDDPADYGLGVEPEEEEVPEVQVSLPRP